MSILVKMNEQFYNENTFRTVVRTETEKLFTSSNYTTVKK